MKIRARPIHKWLGIGLGLLMGLWIVTGIAIVIPRPTPDFVTYPDERPDPGAAAIAPAAVAERLAAEGRRLVGVSLRAVDGETYWEARDAAGGLTLLHATTGAERTFTEADARALLLARLRPGYTIASAETIERHRYFYPFGELPAYRFRITGAAGAEVFVTPTGRLTPLDMSLKLKLGVAGLHDLFVLNPVIGDLGRRGFIAGTGLFLLGLVVTGFYLALPARWRSWRRLRPVAGPTDPA